MNTATFFGILVALLVLLGALLYLAAQFIIKRIESEKIKLIGPRKKLWVWRAFFFMLLLYSLFLLFINKNFFSVYFGGPMRTIFQMFLVVYFVALVELVIIDLLLPDLVQMWKRISIEVVAFVLLCTLAIFSFNFGVILFG